MASVTREKNGTVRIWFNDAAGKRKGIRIGKADDNYADRFKRRVEDLLTASITNTRPHEDTARWVMGLPEPMQDKLARVGLIEIEPAEPEPKAPGVDSFLAGWIDGRCEQEPAKVLRSDLPASPSDDT